MKSTIYTQGSILQLVYLFGGWDGNKDLSDFWSYHIPTNKWKMLSMDTNAEGGPSRRSCHKIVVDITNKHILTSISLGSN